MGDQRIEAWPAFGGEDTCDGKIVRGIRAEAVDGFGGERDEFAVGKPLTRFGNLGLACAKDACFDRFVHLPLS